MFSWFTQYVPAVYKRRVTSQLARSETNAHLSLGYGSILGFLLHDPGLSYSLLRARDAVTTEENVDFRIAIDRSEVCEAEHFDALLTSIFRHHIHDLHEDGFTCCGFSAFVDFPTQNHTCAGCKEGTQRRGETFGKVYKEAATPEGTLIDLHVRGKDVLALWCDAHGTAATARGGHDADAEDTKFFLATSQEEEKINFMCLESSCDKNRSLGLTSHDLLTYRQNCAEGACLRT
ncbi:hypothetical protein E2C01_024205 [Portunus trituberculatus]|uniref:Uncharacterized protein n=1 Tax=Portunus trituberculatus TaxID=210409 RepID=A0A5B7ED79_PORTR|nr:hypothetical protein [Portunus trituberculatus]